MVGDVQKVKKKKKIKKRKISGFCSSLKRKEMKQASVRKVNLPKEGRKKAVKENEELRNGFYFFVVFFFFFITSVLWTVGSLPILCFLVGFLIIIFLCVYFVVTENEKWKLLLASAQGRNQTRNHRKSFWHLVCFLQLVS